MKRVSITIAVTAAAGLGALATAMANQGLSPNFAAPGPAKAATCTVGTPTPVRVAETQSYTCQTTAALCLPGWWPINLRVVNGRFAYTCSAND
jgi:hypothetical protein